MFKTTGDETKRNIYLKLEWPYILQPSIFQLFECSDQHVEWVASRPAQGDSIFKLFLWYLLPVVLAVNSEHWTPYFVSI